MTSTVTEKKAPYAGPVVGRHIAIWIAAFLLLPALYWMIADLAPEAEARWDMSLPWAIGEFHTQNAMRFAQQVERVTEGRVKIAVHPGAVLGLKGPESLRAVSDATVAMADMAGFQQVGTAPLLGLESLPFLIDDQNDLRTLYRFLRPAVERAFAEHGIKVLYIVPWPNQNLYFDVEVDRIADLAGAKVRTYDKNTTALMERLGLTPVQLPSPDVVPALAAGSIDGVMTSTTTAAAQKYWEFLRYIYRSNHIWISNFVGVNARLWNDISEEDQRAIEELAARLEPEFWAVAKADDLKQLAVLERNGIEIAGPSPQMTAEMRALARPAWREFAAENAEAKRIIEDYLAATGREPL